MRWRECYQGTLVNVSYAGNLLHMAAIPIADAYNRGDGDSSDITDSPEPREASGQARPRDSRRPFPPSVRLPKT